MPVTVLENNRGRVANPDHLNGRVEVVIETVKEGVPLSKEKYVIDKIRAFNFDRVTNGVGFMTISFVDENWIEIEQNLLNAKGKFKFKYGYEGDDFESCNYIEVQTAGLELEQYLDYVVLNVSGLCLGTELIENSKLISSCQDIKNFGTELLSNKQAQRNIADFVRAIARSVKKSDQKTPLFKDDPEHIIVDETADILVKDDMFSTDSVQKVFNSKGSNLFMFLIRKLLPLAISKEDKAKEDAAKNSLDPVEKVPFVFYIKADTKGELEFHFHKMDKYKDDVNVVSTFKLFSEGDTRIISYKPSYEHMIANLTMGASVYAWNFSTLSGTLFEEKGKAEQNPSAIKNTPDTQDYRGETQQTGYYSADAEMAARKARRALEMSSNAPLTAELVITGDRAYEICQAVDIEVNIPTLGKPHATSGRYLILGITDTIDMGVFTTKLQLGTAQGTTNQGKKATFIRKEDASLEEPNKNAFIEQDPKKVVRLYG
jgi:hypothetical protein